MSDDAKTLIELELKSALMGDADSIKRVADRLAGPTPSSDPPAGMVAVADVQRAADDRHAFLSAVDQSKRDFPDLWEDERLHAKLQKADRHIAQTEPDLPYAERLHRAGVAVRAWQDQNWDGDEHLRHSVIARMRKTRDEARQKNRMGPSLGEEVEPTELDYETPYRPDAEDIEHSEAIAEMKAGRKATVLNAGD